MIEPPQDREPEAPLELPAQLRSGVRTAIADSLSKDAELRASRTAGRLAIAGVAGAAAAAGAVWLMLEHPMGHHPIWHLAGFSILWTAILVVLIGAALLEIRTVRLHVGEAATIGLVSLSVAALCSLACPERHFLHWWWRTPGGAWITGRGGPALGAACFGLVTTFVFAAMAALAPGWRRRRSAVQPFAETLAVIAALVPGVILQTVGEPARVQLAWVAGTGAGALLGITAAWRGRRGHS